MGWLYGWNSRAELVKHLTHGNGTSAVAHKTTSEQGQAVLWMVAPVRDDFPDEGMRGKNVIVCFLLDTSGGRHGYKDMSEEMHPYYYSCPLSYLNMAVELCPEWREGVRKFHQADQERALYLRRLQIGETVKLAAGCKPPEVTITSTKPLRGMYGGTVYRIPPRMLAV